MRLILALVLLSSCAPASPPQAELAGEPSLGEMTYHCTPDGEEFVRFEHNGARADRFTGRGCDYQAWRADVDANGPLYSRGGLPNYEEWLARRQPEA